MGTCIMGMSSYDEKKAVRRQTDTSRGVKE